MAQAPESDPGASPTVLETLAITGGTPSASSVGNVISVPEPTTVLIKPASPPGAEQRQEVEPAHWARFGWPSCSYWPFGIAGADGCPGVLKTAGISGRAVRSSSWAS